MSVRVTKEKLTLDVASDRPAWQTSNYLAMEV